MDRRKHVKPDRMISRTAKQLRAQLTPAEQILWSALRGRILSGLKFRRQHPFGQYVLDFYCAKRRLAVELDGSVHQEPEQAQRDQERSEFLEMHQIIVLRFQNEEVIEHLDKVLEKILEAVK